MATTKKLIAFEEDQIKLIEAYAEKNNSTFTGSVQELVKLGLESLGKAEAPAPEDEAPAPEQKVLVLDALQEDIDQLKKDIGWWNTDDAQSRIGNAELAIEKLEKKVNVLVQTAKMFKGHLNNREIHLQD